MGYLSRPEWRQHDEALLDWFFEWKRVGKAKSVALIQDAGVLQVTGFFGDLVPQPVVDRQRRFEQMRRRAAGSQIVFLDPDHGLEVLSVRPGTKRFPRYVSWPVRGQRQRHFREEVPSVSGRAKRAFDHVKKVPGNVPRNVPNSRPNRAYRVTSHLARTAT